ncbi:MAG: universal stress protein [Mycetocola sp.]
MTGTIVVGFLPSKTGEAALQEAARLARESDSRLVVVNSSRADSTYDPALATTAMLEVVDEALKGAGIDHIIEQPVGHDPADHLFEAIERYDARLVVIGLRRRSLLGRVLFGSTAQTVLLHSSCSVLAVKPQDDQEE